MRPDKRSGFLTAVLPGLLLSAGGVGGQAWAQGYGERLTIDGLHRQHIHSASAGGFGGVTIGSGHAGMMFLNPASMQALDGVQISLGGSQNFQDLRQEQYFAPVRYYPNLSLLLEGLTDQIPDPDPDLIGFTPADSVQRVHDDIRPNWSRSGSDNVPLHALVAVPISFPGLTLTAGLGAVQFTDVDHYYQNNNVLDPPVLSQRPLPVPRPTDDNPITVNWYQTIRSRVGSIYGYGAALSAHIERLDLSVGVSGLLLNGNSDDFEQRVSRGTLTFYSNAFRSNASSGSITRIGTSEFNGSNFAISSILNGRFVTVGFVLRPPSTYTRTFRLEIAQDSAGTSLNSIEEGEDRLRFPWRGSVGMLLMPHERLRLGIEYDARPYSSATFTSSAQNETSPWHSAHLFRIGVEYTLAPWLIVRAGIRGEADVFVPEGSAIEGDPVTYRAYSGGIGIRYQGVQWNISYENARMRYQDIWGSAVSNNIDARHFIATDVSYTLPIRVRNPP